MFKLAVITDEVSQDFKVAVDLAQRYNLSAVEIRSVYEKGPFELKQTDIDKMQNILSNTNLEVCCISSPFYKCNLDEKKEIEQNIEGLKRCIDMADRLGANIIRGFTFWDKGDFNERTCDIAEMFIKPIQLLKQSNKMLALEFDPTVYATNAQKLLRVIRKINSPLVKALWDPGNDIYDPEHECPYPNGYEIIKDDICHIHLKDARLVEGKPQSTPMCEGEVDYKGQLTRLLVDGYQGYLSLETHYRPTKALSEELLQMPKGSAFSHLGLEASTESLDNIMKLIKEIKQ